MVSQSHTPMPGHNHMTECLFCSKPNNEKVLENDLAYAMLDGFPVTHLHTLVIPKRHAATYFDLTWEEKLACDELISQLKEAIEAEDTTVQGFNIGMNAGECAGQTIFHCHIHLIPRRKGDIENPRGGVRGVIPEKQQY